MIALVLAAGLAWDSDEITLTKPLEFILDVRVGGWASGGFEFEALVPTGEREIDGRAVWTAGVDAGVCLSDRWLIFGGGEYGIGGDLTLVTAHLSVGYRLYISEMIHALPPCRLEVSVGALAGSLDVDKSDFGDFERGFGVRAGVSLVFELGRTFTLGGWVEGRYLRYEYEEETIDGDDHAGGGGIAGGITGGVRF